MTWLLTSGGMFALIGAAHPAGTPLEATSPDSECVVGGSLAAHVDVSAKHAEISFSLLSNELPDDLGVSCGLRLYDSFEAMQDDRRAGRLAIVYGSSIELLESEDEEIDRPMYAFESAGSALSTYQIIVRRDSGLQQIEQLRGARLSITRAEVGRLYLDVTLLEHSNGTAHEFFGDVRQADNSNSALVDVFFGQSDAALVSASGFEASLALNRQIAVELVAIHRSPAFLEAAAVVDADFARRYGQRAHEIASRFHYSPRGNDLIRSFRAERVVRLTPAALDSVRDLVASFHRLREQQ